MYLALSIINPNGLHSTTIRWQLWRLAILHFRSFPLSFFRWWFLFCIKYFEESTLDQFLYFLLPIKSFSASRLLLPISIKKFLRHSASWTILQITSVLFFSHKSILYIPRKSVTINQVAAADSAFILKRPNKAMAWSRFICLNSISLTSFFSHVVFSHPNLSDFVWRNFSLPSSLLELYL